MPRKATKTVYLIASGLTAWQQERRIQGDTDLPLSPDGLRQVTEAAEQWNVEGIKTYFTSPDEASRQTAAIFIARAGAGKVKAVPELAEMNLGLWQGLTRDQLKDRYTTSFSQWQEDPARVNIPEGENFDQAAARMRAAVIRLLNRTNGRPLVLVLRPIMLGLCAEFLNDAEDAEPWTPSHEPPPVQRFELDESRWLAIKASHRPKRMSA